MHVTPHKSGQAAQRQEREGRAEEWHTLNFELVLLWFLEGQGRSLAIEGVGGVGIEQ
jgi:hypothetical protein